MLLAALVVLPAWAQGAEVPGEGGEAAGDGAAVASLHPRFSWSLEGKAHYRDSEDRRIAVPFPFAPDMLPPGATQGFAATVDPGDHLELSTFSLYLDAEWSPALAAHAKLDFIDLYDRNPTSSDQKFDVDEAWVRFGRESEPAVVPERPGVYLKIGKMAKFERQDDRHLESYGLVSTAFNRFEDTGLELGADLGRHLYVKGTLTQGNPLFLRDPNALAGDNGTPELRRANPDPALGSGIPILYDAEVEDFDADGEMEVGAGLGGALVRRRGSERRRRPGLRLPAGPRRHGGAQRQLLRRRPRPAARTGERLPVPHRRAREARDRRQPVALPRRLLAVLPGGRPGGGGARPHAASRASWPGASTCRWWRPPAAGSSSPRSPRRCAGRASTRTSRRRG